MPTMPARPRPVSVVVIILGVLLFVLRRPEGFQDATVWAEDGRFFWAAALYPGFDLTSVYAAQWWMAQRLGALAVVQAPVQWAPTLLYLSACVMAVSAVAVVLQRRARPLFGRYRYQLLAFALVLLLPTAWEVQGNLTNIQVWLGVGMLVVLVLPAPESTVGRLVEVLFVLVSGLTGFLGVLCSPVALWSFVVSRSRYVRLRSSLVLCTAACNVLVWWTAGRSAQEGTLARLVRLPETLAFRWGGGSLLGEYPLREVSSHYRLVLPLAGLFLLAVLVAAWRDRGGPSPVWLLAALLWSALALVSPAGAVGDLWMFDPTAHWRYFALGVAACLLVLVRAVGTSALRWPYWAALAACAPALLIGARLPAMGPPVPSEDLQVFAQCLEIPGGLCMLDIAPPGWTVVVLVPGHTAAGVTEIAPAQAAP